MPNIANKDIRQYIEKNIKVYHSNILKKLLKLKLQDVLKRKNPYLFKAKALEVSSDLVKSVLDAYLSSQEEGLFGGFLEGLAIYICGEVYNGRKSAAEGIDLEFNRDRTHYIVSIKSGPNWGNSQQISKMKDNFRKAKRILGTNNSRRNVEAVNGCCYGKDSKPEKIEYIKLCGQRFWELVSGDENLYTELIEPLGYKAKQKNDTFNIEYSKVVNRFTLEFLEDYCDSNGCILWDKLVKFNSGKD